MENRIIKKVDNHFSEFKNEVKEWFESNKCEIVGNYNKSDFLQFIFDFDNLTLSKEDFQKRKRIKNTVSIHLRCCAKRANGEQCSRRKKEGEDFCGTHSKGTPYGKFDCNVLEVPNITKKDIWIKDIKGINYFIDSEGNVYNHEEVLTYTNNPNIIAQYTLDEFGEYHIPKFGI